MHDLDCFYEKYGLSLTERLTIFEENPLSPPFVFVTEAGNPVEVTEAAKSRLKFDQTVLVWEQYEEVTGDGGRDNVHLNISGSLAVLRQAGSSAANQLRISRECRPLALKCLALMLQDGREGILAENGIRFDFDKNDGGPTISVNGWCGYGYTFSWVVPVDLELTDDDLRNC